MTGNLGLGNGYAVMSADSNSVNVQVYGGDPSDSTNKYNYRALQLLSVAYESDYKNAIRIRDYRNGSSYWYTLYGNHNLPVMESVAYSSIGSIAVNGTYKVTGTPGILIHLQWDTNYAIQIFNNYSTYTKLQWRYKYNGSWGSWTTM